MLVSEKCSSGVSQFGSIEQSVVDSIVNNVSVIRKKLFIGETILQVIHRFEVPMNYDILEWQHLIW